MPSQRARPKEVGALPMDAQIPCPSLKAFSYERWGANMPIDRRVPVGEDTMVTAAQEEAAASLIAAAPNQPYRMGRNGTRGDRKP